MAMLPTIEHQAQFHEFKADATRCRQAVEAVSALHGIDASRARCFAKGSAIVYQLDDHLVLKLFSPLFPNAWRTETVVLDYLANRLSVATPNIHHRGHLEGWPYLIMQRVPGIPLVEVWERLTISHRHAICHEAGRLLRDLHGLPIDGLASLGLDWQTFRRNQIENLVHHQRDKQVNEFWIERMAEYVAAISWDQQEKQVLLHTEFMRDHLLVSQAEGEWKITGLLDFEPAMVGSHEYDFGSVALFVTGGEPGLLATFFDGYGYAKHDLTPALRRRIMAYIFLHRYSDLNWYLRFMPGSEAANSVEDLEAAWLCFDEC